MNTVLKLAFAAWLAPGLVAGVAALTVGVGVLMWWVGGMLALVGLLAISAAALKRWLRQRFSPVRRRHPRPIAWRQWR